MIYSNIYWGKNQDVNPDLVLQRVGTSEVLMLMKTLVSWPEILKSWSESERWSDGLMFLRLIWLALRKHMFSGWRPKIIQLIRHKMETISISPNGSTLRFGSRWGNSYSSKQLLGTDADIKGSRFQAVSSLCILFWCDVGLSWVSGLWDIFVHKTSRSVDDPQWRLQTTDHWPFRFVSESRSFFHRLCATSSFYFGERTQTTSYSYMRPNHPYLYLCIYIMFLMFVSHTLPCWFAYRLLGFCLSCSLWLEGFGPNRMSHGWNNTRSQSWRRHRLLGLRQMVYVVWVIVLLKLMQLGGKIRICERTGYLKISCLIIVVIVIVYYSHCSHSI